MTGNYDWMRYNDQFSETPEERNERQRNAREKRNKEILWNLIADLSVNLADEEHIYSVDGLNKIRKRTANALPDEMCPDWLKQYRDPPLVQS